MIPVCNANTNGATGWCLEPHDIAVAKYFATAMSCGSRHHPVAPFVLALHTGINHSRQSGATRAVVGLTPST